MRNLIVYAHPYAKSFCHSILEMLTSALTPGTFAVRDLYALKFNPVLSPDELMNIRHSKVLPEIAEEQEYIREAKNISFVYPVWHAGPPAILKGYWDRVFTRGFAYDYCSNGLVGLLTGKNAAFMRTQGASKKSYELTHWPAMRISSSEVMRKYGIDIIEDMYFPGVVTASEETRADYLKHVKEFAKTINVCETYIPLDNYNVPVSYTHLTLPTICSV
eukprot:TRINITY_DN7760_c0_g1_i11.p1 TRINITY_DN7760_c0_g1~~TRINITY_DN7760_c0_g1_i11.p1  ORF type:complete len:218 (-),score=45.14 TRINITY_DN7760_c0_g1_i11:39-692(-)